MKLKTRWQRQKQENEYLSDTNCLSRALIEARIDKEQYSKGEVAKVFKMCDKTDYGNEDRDEVLESLYRLNFENIDQ